MSLNESIVEHAALERSLLRRGYSGQVVWLGYAVGHEPHLAPGKPASRDGGRDSFGEGVQFRCAPSLIPAFSQKEKEWCEAIRRQTPAIPSRVLANLRDPAGTELPKLLSGELSVGALDEAGAIP